MFIAVKFANHIMTESTTKFHRLVSVSRYEASARGERGCEGAHVRPPRCPLRGAHAARQSLKHVQLGIKRIDTSQRHLH